jgi:hypothetical protein
MQNLGFDAKGVLDTGWRRLLLPRHGPPRNIRQVLHFLTDTGKWEYRITFLDQSGVAYELPVTDLAFRYFLERLRQGDRFPPNEATNLVTSLNSRQTYLRIGLARHWEKHPDHCFVQVTGIHTIPDYLNGCCFADL